MNLLETRWGTFYEKYFPKSHKILIKYWDWSCVFSAMSARQKCQNFLKYGVFFKDLKKEFGNKCSYTHNLLNTFQSYFENVLISCLKLISAANSSIPSLNLSYERGSRTAILRSNMIFYKNKKEICNWIFAADVE